MSHLIKPDLHTNPAVGSFDEVKRSSMEGSIEMPNILQSNWQDVFGILKTFSTFMESQNYFCDVLKILHVGDQT